MEVGKHFRRKELHAAGEKQLNLKGGRALGMPGTQPTTKTERSYQSPPEYFPNLHFVVQNPKALTGQLNTSIFLPLYHAQHGH